MNLNLNGCFLKGDVFVDLHPASDETVILKLKWTEKPLFFLATCVATGRRSAAGMTPREGGYLLLYLIVSLLCRHKFLKLVFLLLPHFLKLLPLSLREDRFYLFIGGADHFFECVQFVLA